MNGNNKSRPQRQRGAALFISVYCLLRADNGVNGWMSKPLVSSSSLQNAGDRGMPTRPSLYVTSQPKFSSKAPGKQHMRSQKKNSIKAMFQDAKKLERQGKWNEASELYIRILGNEPKDAHSHLALARLEARRESKKPDMCSDALTRAQHAFKSGTLQCPDSVHLWQAWAVYEDSRGHTDRARELYEQALKLDPQNPYVCHAFGLYYKKLGMTEKAMDMFRIALASQSTAALVCSLGELLVGQDKLEDTRLLYSEHLPKLTTEKDQIEVYLAAAWLEERCFKDVERAMSLLNMALKLSPDNSLANVAMARLEGRINQKTGNHTSATAKRLANACKEIEERKQQPSDRTDGRVFNALAQIEVRARQFNKAREILRRGIQMYPLDHNLFQAAGKVEERVGNYTAARRMYGESLQLEPSAATLVAYTMLEARHPTNGTVDLPRVRRLFEEALLLDPRHGPAYNAYGNIELQRGCIEQARAVFERGVQADCSDAGSLYHGYGKLELSLGNVDAARSILEKGLERVRAKEIASDSTHRERAKFLSHTLGMIELNSNRPAIAREIFQDGIQRCGNSSRLLLGAALSEMRLGKEDAARVLFERSILVDRKHAQAWQAWGVMETKAGNFKTASTLFQCGIQSVPSHGALWHGYASLEIKRDNVHNARVLYAAGLQKAPNHVPLYQGWALLELREGNFQDSKKLITEALTRNKKNGSGWLIAAQIEKEQGNNGLVSLILRRGIECAPNDPELYRKLGEDLVSRGKYNDAREVFEKGMEFNPLYAPLYHSLAELEARVFNLEGLSKLNKRAAELFNNNVMDPAQSSSQAYATKIRAKRAPGLMSGIKALAEKIVDDDDERVLLGTFDRRNPSKTLESLTGSLLEDEFVGGLLNPLDYENTPERIGDL